MFAVAGVSGRTGSAVARALLDSGEKIRVLVRDPRKGDAFRKRGAEVAQADLGDAKALAAALRGAKGAYLLLPPPGPSATKVLAGCLDLVEAIAAAVAASRVEHVVFLSSLGADKPKGTGLIQPLHAAEQKLGPLRKRMSFVRAASFMENWESALPAAQGGALQTFLPARRRLPMVAIEDVGRVAAQLLRDRPGRGRLVELAGPADYSAEDVARALGRLLGKTVEVAPRPAAEMAAALSSLGFTTEMARLYQETTFALESGHIALGNAGALQVRGPTTLQEALAAVVKRQAPAVT